MRDKSNAPEAVDAYIAGFPLEVQAVLEQLRATVRKAAPAAQERISYRMPAFFQDGVLVYFAAFKKHIGLYPPVRDLPLKAVLERYAGPKGNLKFLLDEPIPYALISRVVKARLRENTARRSAPTQKSLHGKS